MVSTTLTFLKTFSWQELRHHPWRNLAALLAVMLGVALAFSVQLINQSALSEFSAAVRAVNGVPDFELRGQRGGFDEALHGWGGEDLEFGIRLAAAGLKFKRLEGIPAFHHAPRVRDPAKARSAGYQAVMIAKKHGARVGLQLGVDQRMLSAKALYLNPVGDFVLRGAADYAFERAYLEGARAAWRELEA